jgi:hypothetical protein
MEAKREALMAKTLLRKEQIDQKVEEIEAKNADKRMEEQRKLEMVESRKFEKEMRRLVDEILVKSALLYCSPSFY